MQNKEPVPDVLALVGELARDNLVDCSERLDFRRFFEAALRPVPRHLCAPL